MNSKNSPTTRRGIQEQDATGPYPRSSTSILLSSKQLTELKEVAAALGQFLREQNLVVGTLESDMLTMDDGARFVGVSRRTLQTWCADKNKGIERYRLGDGVVRISLKSLRAYIESCKEGK